MLHWNWICVHIAKCEANFCIYLLFSKTKKFCSQAGHLKSVCGLDVTGLDYLGLTP